MNRGAEPETTSYASVAGGAVVVATTSSPLRGGGLDSPAFGAVTSHQTAIR